MLLVHLRQRRLTNVNLKLITSDHLICMDYCDLYLEYTVEFMLHVFITFTAISRRPYPQLWSLDQKHGVLLVHSIRDEEHHPERLVKTSCFILLALIQEN